MKCEYCGITDKETRILKTAKYGTLCRRHYLQKYRHGTFFATIYEPNEIVINDEYAEIILRDKRGNETGRAKIDIEDVERAKKYKWHAKRGCNTQYVTAHINEKEKILLHRYVLNYAGDLDIDHINHNGLDNRKSNLRIVSHSLNMSNQYREYKGVRLVPSGNYQAIAMKDGKLVYLGTFSSFDEALKARKEYEEKLFSSIE